MSSFFKTFGIIPAHLNSKRFPQKLFKKIGNVSLLEMTYKNALHCSKLTDLYVATYQEEVVDHVRAFGGKALLTKKIPKTGSECIAHIVLENDFLQQSDCILNIQGDEPEVKIETLNKLISSLEKNPLAELTTPIALIVDEDKLNPHLVKCVINQKNEALYFSRSPIPYNSLSGYQHLGIYAFKTDFLLKTLTLPKTPLQLAEDLEQLQFLEHGYTIQCIIVEANAKGIDTQEDFDKLCLHVL